MKAKPANGPTRAAAIFADPTTWRALGAEFYPLEEVDLSFRKIDTLAQDGKTLISSWGLCATGFIVHPVYGEFNLEVSFRLTHAASGGAIVDLPSLEAAVGLLQSVRGLDWSGSVEEFVPRNQRAVLAAIKQWQSIDADAPETRPS